MFKKWQAVNQTVITSGCLQMVYLTGSNLDKKHSDPIKTYAEHLDIFLVFDGELTIKTFNQKRTVNPGDVFFYTRSTYAEVSITSKNFSGARLRFIRDRVESDSINRRFAASMLGSGLISQKIKNHCLSFIQLIEAPNEVIPDKTVKLIQRESEEILETLSHLIEAEHETLDIVDHELSKARLVVSAVNIFESNMRNTPKIKNIVEELGVSHSYFVRIFKRHIGVAPNVFSRTLKVNYSLSLIGTDIESLSDISYILGFSDQSHFSNTFRETLQFTPGAASIRTIH